MSFWNHETGMTDDANHAPFEVLANSIPHIVWSAGADGVFDYANARWTEYTGRSPRSDGAEWLDLLHPDDRDRIAATWTDIIASGKPFECKYRIKRFDGRYRWHLSRGLVHRAVDGQFLRWFGTLTDIDDFDRGFPMRDEHGNVGRVAGIAEDISARRALEHDLEMNHHLLASVQQAIISTDTSGVIVTWNRHAEVLFGWTAAEAMGERIVSLLFIDGQLDESARVSSLELALGKQVAFERQLKRKNGSLIWVSTTAAPIIDASGEVTHFVGASVDVTDRRNLEHQLRQAQKMEAVGRLAGGVAHDFNNLLTIIKGHTEFLSAVLPSAGESREDIDQIEKAAHRAAALTRQLLSFSRRHVLEKRVIDVNTLLRDLEKMLVRLIGEDITLSLSLQPDIPKVLADRGHLEQSIMNLIVNSRDAMQGGGSLTLSSRTVVVDSRTAARHAEALPGKYTAIDVEDTGSGIDSALMVKIFEPFFTTKAAGRGTGLGLASVYGIVKQSGGFIDVESTSGKGSIFTIFLPEAPSNLPVEATRNSLHPAGGNELILLVEDEDDVRGVARKILAAHGYTVIEARNGVAALTVLRGLEKSVDLVITDAIMPQMGGVDLVRALRADRPQLRVVMVSGYANSDAVDQGAAELGIPFLSKPFRSEDLLAVVRQALDASVVM
jgi:two-component system, cell cycle sensor histidine kinase and response regulator CckA